MQCVEKFCKVLQILNYESSTSRFQRVHNVHTYTLFTVLEMKKMRFVKVVYADTQCVYTQCTQTRNIHITTSVRNSLSYMYTTEYVTLFSIRNSLMSWNI